MDKLTNIVIDIEAGIISFWVSSETTIDTSDVNIYIDEFDNVENIYSDDELKHDYIFNSQNSVISVNSRRVVIENDEIATLSSHLKCIRFVTSDINAEGIYYNPEVIYEATLTNLKSVCSTCLDDKTMQTQVYVTFKKQLLDVAIELNKTKEAMGFYKDIHRILNMDNVIEEPCNTCVNGCCTIK